MSWPVILSLRSLCSYVVQRENEGGANYLWNYLNTHTPAALYQAFELAEANPIWDRLEFHYTPKHRNHKRVCYWPTSHTKFG